MGIVSGTRMPGCNEQEEIDARTHLELRELEPAVITGVSDSAFRTQAERLTCKRASHRGKSSCTIATTEVSNILPATHRRLDPQMGIYARNAGVLERSWQRRQPPLRLPFVRVFTPQGLGSIACAEVEDYGRTLGDKDIRHGTTVRAYDGLGER